jgi:hypothetical protein
MRVEVWDIELDALDWFGLGLHRGKSKMEDPLRIEQGDGTLPYQQLQSPREDWA